MYEGRPTGKTVMKEALDNARQIKPRPKKDERVRKANDALVCICVTKINDGEIKLSDVPAHLRAEVVSRLRDKT